MGDGEVEAGEAVAGGEVVAALGHGVDGGGDAGELGGGEVGGVELGAELGEDGVAVVEKGGDVGGVVLAASLLEEEGLRGLAGDKEGGG